jgi:hypothetical protein
VPRKSSLWDRSAHHTQLRHAEEEEEEEEEDLFVFNDTIAEANPSLTAVQAERIALSSRVEEEEARRDFDLPIWSEWKVGHGRVTKRDRGTEDAIGFSTFISAKSHARRPANLDPSQKSPLNALRPTLPSVSLRALSVSEYVVWVCAWVRIRYLVCVLLTWVLLTSWCLSSMQCACKARRVESPALQYEE